MAAMDADRGVAGPLEELEAGAVGGEDLAGELVAALRRRLLAGRGEQRRADATPPRVAGDVDGDLPHPRVVGVDRVVLADPGGAGDLAVQLRDEEERPGGDQPLEVEGLALAGLERGDPLPHAGVVDLRDPGRVGAAGGTDPRLAHAASAPSLAAWSRGRYSPTS